MSAEIIAADLQLDLFRVDLSRECLHAFELSFRPKVSEETYLDILAVDILVEIEQMNFERSLRLAAADRRPKAKIDHAMMLHSLDPGFGEVDSIGRKLFAMRA